MSDILDLKKDIMRALEFYIIWFKRHPLQVSLFNYHQFSHIKGPNIPECNR